MEMMTLQEVSDQTGASVRSLRYYIGKGWLPQPQFVPNGPGRPAGRLPSTCLGKVALIQSVIHSTASETITAPSLGVYVYDDDGVRVKVDIVKREEEGAYALLTLRNGDTILRKKTAEGRESITYSPEEYRGR